MRLKQCIEYGFIVDHEEPFDLVEPGRTGRCEVHVITRSRWEPFLYLRMFVSSVVVEDEVEIQLDRRGFLATAPNLLFNEYRATSSRDVARADQRLDVPPIS